MDWLRTLWRAWLYLGTGAALGFVALAVTVVLTAVGVALSPVLIGLIPLAVVGLSGVPVGAIERRRLRLLGERPAPSPHRPPAAGGWRQWLRTRWGESATWREFAYTMLLITGLWLLDFAVAALPVVSLGLVFAPLAYGLSADPRGLVLFGVELPSWPAALRVGLAAVIALVASAFVVAAVARLHGRVVLTLLVSPPVDNRVMELVRTTGRLLDAFDAERRRIERDLHDGVQQRLVALGVTLDVARMRATDAPEWAQVLSTAHTQATAALGELRELVRGIHPHVLTERGFAPAVEELATGYPIPIELEMRIDGRLASTVESTAYFVVSEALANMAKHAEAQRAWVRARLSGGRLHVEVGDTGRGGADPARGSGVRGLADRVAAVGGRLMLSSPPGGPTVLRAEIPCPPGRS